MPFDLGVLAGGAASALGSVASSLLSNSSALRNQREMLEYNKPANQVKRLREAGINPALAMQQGMMDSGNASAPADTMPQFDVNSLASGVRDAVQVRQQKDLNDAMISEHQQNSLATAIRNKTQLVRDIADLYNRIADTKEKGGHTELMQKQVGLLEKQLSTYDDNFNANLNVLKAQQSKLNEEALTESALRQVRVLATQASIKLSKSQANYFVEMAKQTQESVNQMKLNGASQREINSFVRDRERETARRLNLENNNWYNTYLHNISEQEARTRQSNTASFLGVPIDLSGGSTNFGATSVWMP